MLLQKIAILAQASYSCSSGLADICCCRKAQLKMLSAAKDAVRARCCQTGQRRPKMKCRQGMSRSPIKATDEVLLLAKVPNDGELAQLETRVFWRG